MGGCGSAARRTPVHGLLPALLMCDLLASVLLCQLMRPASRPAAAAPQITVTIVGVKSGARRRLLDSVSVETQITVDSGSTAQEQQQALNAVTTVTQQMTEVGAASCPRPPAQPAVPVAKPACLLPTSSPARVFPVARPPARPPACLPACLACLACLTRARPRSNAAARPNWPQNKEEFINSALDTGAGSLTETAGEVVIEGEPQQGTLQQDNTVQTCTAQQDCNDPAANCACNLPTAPTCLAVASPAGAAGQCVVSRGQGGSLKAALPAVMAPAATPPLTPDPRTPHLVLQKLCNAAAPADDCKRPPVVLHARCVRPCWTGCLLCTGGACGSYRLAF